MQALASFTPEQQAAWLRFVTACSRAPLLGFAFLEPRLCVQACPPSPLMSYLLPVVSSQISAFNMI